MSFEADRIRRGFAPPCSRELRSALPSTSLSALTLALGIDLQKDGRRLVALRDLLKMKTCGCL